MKYVIVGGSAAGTAAAREIRRHDPDGSITMLSRDPGFFSRCQLHLIASRQRSVQQADFLPENWADTLAVQVRHGVSAARVDTARKIVHTDAGEEIPYGRLLVATGSRTAMPPIEGLEGSGTLGFRDLEDVQALRAALPDAGRVAIVGAGLVGCELAAELAGMGKSVTLVELAAHPLPLQLEEETGAMCAQLLRRAGIDVICSDAVTKVERTPNGDPLGLRLRSGRAVPADMVVVAAGVKANTELLGGSGAATNRGIVIDRHCRTSLADVYAAGDVTETEDVVVNRVMPSAIWPAAIRQGVVAGANMAGRDESLAKNTGMRASVGLLGTSVVSLGAVNMARASGWTKHVFRHTNSRGQDCLKVLFTEERRLMGALLWGDITNAGVYGEAIINGRDMTADLPAIDELDGAKRGVETLSIA
jgi:NAD(P)H-nitrite reductase large subunit